ncbi:hypothetical protein BDZ91DRAFT_769051 [Kalaharituber pfeilii]|nr:hypothetical protein BDZ91DRAFT_769051 [Kalaharituber pfeilii]
MDPAHPQLEAQPGAGEQKTEVTGIWMQAGLADHYVRRYPSTAADPDDSTKLGYTGLRLRPNGRGLPFRPGSRVSRVLSKGRLAIPRAGLAPVACFTACTKLGFYSGAGATIPKSWAFHRVFRGMADGAVQRAGIWASIRGPRLQFQKFGFGNLRGS